MINPSSFSSEWRDAAGRRAARIAPSALFFAWLAGCSVSIPIPGFVDPEPTGAIKAKAAPLFDPQDWKTVEPALREAMRAQASSAPIAWSHEATGRRGKLLPVAAPFVREGASCRAFVAETTEHEETKSWQAVACAKDGEDVAVSDVAPWKGL